MSLDIEPISYQEAKIEFNPLINPLRWQELNEHSRLFLVAPNKQFIDLVERKENGDYKYVSSIRNPLV